MSGDSKFNEFRLRNSFRLFSVRKAQGRLFRVGGREDVGIFNFISNFAIIIPGLKGINPALWKPAVKGHAGRGTRWFRVINSLY
jgi:hypothetical protein